MKSTLDRSRYTIERLSTGRCVYPNVCLRGIVKVDAAFSFQKNQVKPIAINYEKTVNRQGLPIMILTDRMIVPSPPKKAHKKTAAADRRSRTQRPHEAQFDRRKQVIIYVDADGGCVKYGGNERCVAERRQVNADEWDGDGTDDDEQHLAVERDDAEEDGTTANRKGRPKGSKNKGSLFSSFSEECAKRAFDPRLTNTDCKLCGVPFEGSATRHALLNHKSLCPVCGGSFKPSSLAAHVKSHGPQPMRVTVTCRECYRCREKFGNAETMVRHVTDEHVARDSATCCLCDVKPPPEPCDSQWLVKHVTDAHSDPSGLPDSCGYCGQPVDRYSLLDHLFDRHLRPSGGDGDFKCELCGNEPWPGPATLVEHLVRVHCPIKTFSRPSLYRCRVCQSGFKSQINVLRHACHLAKGPPHCEPCDKTFPSKMRYLFHLQFHQQPDHEPMHLRCDLCLIEFDDEYQLYDHIRFRHELHDKAVCEVCGRTFKSAMGLNMHRRYHDGSRNFTCKSCNKSFLNNSTLKEHEISHMDVKPYQCHICYQYLSRASRLRSHVKTHRAADSLPQLCHCCAECGFVAPGADALAEHAAKAHDRTAVTGSQIELTSVVKCEYCDSTYADAQQLNRHREATHSADAEDPTDQFVCMVCSSTFSSYSRLTTHKLTHGISMESVMTDGDDEQPELHNRFQIPQYFSCQYCAKRCLHYTYFCLHKRLKHQRAVQTFACDPCRMTFDTSWKQSYHKRTAHGASPDARDQPPAKHKCTVCDREFTKIGALNLHKTRTHINVAAEHSRKCLCPHCGKFFNSECALKTHSKTHDRPPPRRGPREPETDRRRAPGPRSAADRAECALCAVRPQHPKLLRAHLEQHATVDLVFLCRACYAPFLSSDAFDCHVAAQHPADAASSQIARLDVQFVGAPPQLLPPPGQSLVVDCANIFNKPTPPCRPDGKPLIVDIAKTFVAHMPPHSHGPSGKPTTPLAAFDGAQTSPAVDAAKTLVKLSPPQPSPPTSGLFEKPSAIDVKSLFDDCAQTSPPLSGSIETPSVFPAVGGVEQLPDLINELLSNGRGTPPPPDNSLETSVFDELFNILSSPNISAALENIHCEPLDDLASIFDSFVDGK